MKFILLVEGNTERRVLPEFLRRWLNEKLSTNIGIKADKVAGIQDMRTKASKYMMDPKFDDYIAIVGLLDLYGLEGTSIGSKSIDEFYDSEIARISKDLDENKFRMFFAVHELEAWLLSDPAILPTEVARALPSSVNRPETVDFDEPPGKLLIRLYREKLRKRKFKKTSTGSALFSKLDPQLAHSKCPYLAKMLDEMLVLAKAALEK